MLDSYNTLKAKRNHFHVFRCVVFVPGLGTGRLAWAARYGLEREGGFNRAHQPGGAVG